MLCEKSNEVTRQILCKSEVLHVYRDLLKIVQLSTTTKVFSNITFMSREGKYPSEHDVEESNQSLELSPDTNGGLNAEVENALTDHNGVHTSCSRQLSSYLKDYYCHFAIKPLSCTTPNTSPSCGKAYFISQYVALSMVRCYDIGNPSFERKWHVVTLATS
ncbi:hypothetical protein CR513_02245, partial [Mucuna pruriens]